MFVNYFSVDLLIYSLNTVFGSGQNMLLTPPPPLYNSSVNCLKFEKRFCYPQKTSKLHGLIAYHETTAGDPKDTFTLWLMDVTDAP